MLQESDLIPFETSKIPDGPWVVFSPHPDDESFGMGGTLILASEQNIEVVVVFMTSGGWIESPENSSTENNDLADIRETEARNACNYIGIEHVIFWREKDRHLCVTSSLNNKVQRLIERHKPAVVFIPAPTELHPDHRAACEIVCQASAQCRHSTQYATYDIGVQSPVNYFIDISSVAHRKQDLMAMYDSQVSQKQYIELVNSLDFARTFTLPDAVISAEGFYFLTAFPGQAINPIEQMTTLIYDNETQTPIADQSVVSVIVRTFNRPKLLRCALQSIAIQTFPSIEVIVINNGGEDIERITAESEVNFFSLKLINLTKSVGRSAALNIGIEEAQGGYITFLDDDDWWDVTHIENLMKALNSKNALVGYSGVRLIDTNQERHKEIGILNHPFDRNRFYYENYIPINAVMISKEIFDRGCHFDESLSVFEDWDFWIKLLIQTIEFIHIPEITANYRIHDGQTFGIAKGNEEIKRLIYERGSKQWGVDEINDLLTRLSYYANLHSERN